MKFTLQFTPSVQIKTQQIPHPIYYKNYFMKNQSLVKPKSFLCIMLVKQNTDFFHEKNKELAFSTIATKKQLKLSSTIIFFKMIIF